MRKIRSFLVAASLTALSLCQAPKVDAKEAAHWRMGAPIATYWFGPAITDIRATQMAQGNFNLIWCRSEDEIKIAGKHGLRALLEDKLLTPQSLDDPAQLAKLDALIARVKTNPAFYCYFLADEPDASLFPGLGRLVAHLRALDPAHLAYINLLPTYANNNQLGVNGETVAAYKEYLRQFSQIVKPDLLSYDHYHFTVDGDSLQYFLNLGLMRRHALATGVPFLNIIQACTWDKSMRAPNGNEMSWLTNTSLAYGAEGQSFFLYYCEPFYEKFKEKAGQMMRPDGSTTEQYDAAKRLNAEFIAIASQLQPLRSVGAYHIGKAYLGAEMLPKKATFQLKFTGQGDSFLPADGMLLGYFAPTDKAGKPGEPSHVMVVNLDYRHAVTTTVVGPGRITVFDAATQQWTRTTGSQATITLPPGGGKLVKFAE